MSRMPVAAALGASLLLVTSGCEAPRSWQYVTPGATLYTGDGFNPDLPPAICSSVSSAIHYHSNNGDLAGCITVRHGMPVMVETIIPSPCSDFSQCAAVARVRAANNAWSGYTILAYMQPDIRPGTILHVGEDWSSPAWLMPNPNSTKGSINVEDGHVEVLRYEPQNRLATLFVVVLDGSYKRRKGWMSVGDVITAFGHGDYGLMEPIAK
ncbi:MAG TPA: hypothetical protein VGZ02_16625 [Candidatus Baltobacteraceae bacterium]|nr:hypothetical protein [Candidatus Baltobacteraceae bacterium]